MKMELFCQMNQASGDLESTRNWSEQESFYHFVPILSANSIVSSFLFFLSIIYANTFNCAHEFIFWR